jgi:hypothetical protein
MKNFDSYVQDANRLCKEMLSKNDSGIVEKELNCMQAKISHSRLNSHQKDSLIQQLHSTSEAILLRQLWNEISKSRYILY